MATRGALVVRIDGQDKVTYVHSDSAPDGLGKALATFLATSPLEPMRVAGRALQPATGRPSREEARRILGALGEDVVLDWEVVLDHTQGDLAALLAAGRYEDQGVQWLASSLMCEWAYVVNLDEACLEVYRGIQRAPHERGRYALPTGELVQGDTYYPVALIGTFPFATPPTKADWKRLELDGADERWAWTRKFLAEKHGIRLPKRRPAHAR